MSRAVLSRRTAGSIPELFPLDLLLEEPSAGQIEVAEIDLVTGRLNPHEGPARGAASSSFRKLRSGETVTSDDDDDDDDAG